MLWHACLSSSDKAPWCGSKLTGVPWCLARFIYAGSPLVQSGNRVYNSLQGMPDSHVESAWKRRVGGVAAHLAASHASAAGRPDASTGQVCHSWPDRDTLHSTGAGSKLTWCLSGTQSVRRGILVYSPEVWRALRAGAPVVALESTIISHGMPFPQNLETAQQVRWRRTAREARLNTQRSLCSDANMSLVFLLIIILKALSYFLKLLVAHRWRASSGTTAHPLRPSPSWTASRTLASQQSSCTASPPGADRAKEAFFLGSRLVAHSGAHLA